MPSSKKAVPNSPVDLIHRMLQTLMTKKMAEFSDLFAEDAVLEYMFAPPGSPKQLVGRAAIDAYLHNFPDHLDFRELKEMRVHETTNPEVVVAEFTIAGIVTATGRPYESRYIGVATVRDGHLVHYRDYWNPMLFTDLVPGGLG